MLVLEALLALIPQLKQTLFYSENSGNTIDFEPYRIRALDKESRYCSFCYFGNITA